MNIQLYQTCENCPTRCVQYDELLQHGYLQHGCCNMATCNMAAATWLLTTWLLQHGYLQHGYLQHGYCNMATCNMATATWLLATWLLQHGYLQHGYCNMATCNMGDFVHNLHLLHATWKKYNMCSLQYGQVATMAATWDSCKMVTHKRLHATLAT